MGEVLILKKILDPQIHRGLSSINKTKKYKYLTPFHKNVSHCIIVWTVNELTRVVGIPTQPQATDNMSKGHKGFQFTSNLFSGCRDLNILTVNNFWTHIDLFLYMIYKTVSEVNIQALPFPWAFSVDNSILCTEEV
jgi:hypothetical protein